MKHRPNDKVSQFCCTTLDGGPAATVCHGGHGSAHPQSDSQHDRAPAADARAFGNDPTGPGHFGVAERGPRAVRGKKGAGRTVARAARLVTPPSPGNVCRQITYNS
jgi:hypothetical protein